MIKRNTAATSQLFPFFSLSLSRSIAIIDFYCANINWCYIQAIRTKLLTFNCASHDSWMKSSLANCCIGSLANAHNNHSSIDRPWNEKKISWSEPTCANAANEAAYLLLLFRAQLNLKCAAFCTQFSQPWSSELRSESGSHLLVTSTWTFFSYSRQ